LKPLAPFVYPDSRDDHIVFIQRGAPALFAYLDVLGLLPALRRADMSAIIDRTFAREFAAEWIAAWNSGDLERILSHYADDFEIRSPLIAERGFSPTGVSLARSCRRLSARLI
jgi:hypothetical protein